MKNDKEFCMINTFLFDLDGTLLPLDIDAFMTIYFDEMHAVLKDIIEKDKLIEYIWNATGAMIKSTENKTNEDVFMETFTKMIPQKQIRQFIDAFDTFYDDGFLKTKGSTSQSTYMIQSIQILKEKGYQLVVATNPLFPKKAILHRIQWAGLTPEDFSYITHYEKNHFCKPQIQYYEEVLLNIHKTPEECLMVGNDVQEDLIASQLGIKTFLIVDYLIHRKDTEIRSDFQGDYEAFFQFVKDLPEIK